MSKNKYTTTSLSLLLLIVSFWITGNKALASNPDDEPRDGLMAYINMDSIYTKYKLAIAVKDSIDWEQIKIGSALKEVHTALSKEKADFEMNIENNDAYSEAEKEEARAKLDQSIVQVQQLYIKMENYMDKYQRDMFERVNDAIAEHIDDFSHTTGYEYIFVNSTSGWDLYTSPQYDLTNDFVEFMNKRYSIIESITE